MSRRIPGTARVLNLYPDYFTFTFLRNPYERFVSLWLDLRRVARERRGGGREAGRKANREATCLASLRGFAEFSAEVLADFGPCWGRDAAAAFRAKRDRVYGPGRLRLGDLGWSADHLWPQTAFLPDCNPARLFGVARANAEPLSFIGSVERLDEDFARLSELLGLPGGAFPRRNARGAGTGAARSRRYAAHYDGVTRRLVEELYASDLAFTGCGFDDGRGAVTVPRRASGLAARRPAPLRPAPARRPAGTLPARAWHALWSLSAVVEARIVRLPPVWRALRPLALRRGPGGARRRG